MPSPAHERVKPSYRRGLRGKAGKPYVPIDPEAFEDATGWASVRDIGDEFYGPCLVDSHNHGDGSGKFHINFQSGMYICHKPNHGGGKLSDLLERVLGEDEGRRAYEELPRGEVGSYERERPPLPDLNPAKWIEPLDRAEDWAKERDIRPMLHKADLRLTDDGTRVRIPHWVWTGKRSQLVGWQDRSLDGSEPKYLNSTGLPCNAAMYGLHWILESIDAKLLKPDTRLIVTESTSSCLRFLSEEYRAVSTFGAGIAAEHLGQLVDLARDDFELVLVKDDDDEGEAWQAGISEGLTTHGC